MRTRRLVVCLDVKGGRVVKGTRFEGLRDVGDPVALAERYEAQGADEIVFLDVSATLEERSAMLDVAARTAERLFVPLTLGGGIRTERDVADALRAGADKVSLNSAAVRDPSILGRCAERFGAQCVVLSVDAKRRPEGGWLARTHGGQGATELDAVAWCARGAALGAGEILLTSIDRDGARTGYDLELLREVAARVSVPIVASGGAGEAAHLVDAVAAGADAVLVAGILHDGLTTVGALKAHLGAAGVPVRAVSGEEGAP